MRADGVYSEYGRRDEDGRQSEAQIFSLGTGGDARGRNRDVETAPWFNPVDDDFVSDCPGGVCPVPWVSKDNPVFTIEETPKIAEDTVNHPSHYVETGGVECIESIEAQLTTEEYEGYLRGNCVKYLWRWKNKGGVQDLKKCKWYLERLIEINDSE